MGKAKQEWALGLGVTLTVLAVLSLMGCGLLGGRTPRTLIVREQQAALVDVLGVRMSQIQVTASGFDGGRVHFSTDSGVVQPKEKLMSADTLIVDALYTDLSDDTVTITVYDDGDNVVSMTVLELQSFEQQVRGAMFDEGRVGFLVEDGFHTLYQDREHWVFFSLHYIDREMLLFQKDVLLAWLIANEQNSYFVDSLYYKKYDSWQYVKTLGRHNLRHPVDGLISDLSSIAPHAYFVLNAQHARWQSLYSWSMVSFEADLGHLGVVQWEFGEVPLLEVPVGTPVEALQFASVEVTFETVVSGPKSRISVVDWQGGASYGQGMEIGSYDFTAQLVVPEGIDPETHTIQLTVAVVDGAADNPLEFADENLEAAVRTAIEKPVGPLYPADVVALEELWAEGLGITSLVGIESLSNLTRLEFGPDRHDSWDQDLWTYNDIADLTPLAGLTNLRTLVLAHNPVTDLASLANMNQMTTLDLGNTLVTDIDVVTNMPVLRRLLVPGCPIAHLAVVQNLTDLRILDISATQIESLPNLHRLVNLEFLNFSANQVSDISALAGLTQLQNLVFFRNQVSDISSLQGLINLTMLHASDNEISNISVLEPLTALTHLYLRNNSVTDIGVLESLHDLTFVDVVSNYLDVEESSSAMAVIRDLLLRNVQVRYEPQRAQTYTVAGFVQTSDEAGLAGVTISFSDGASMVTTDNAGHWSRSGLSGTVTVTPSKAGYSFVPAQRTVTGETQDVTFQAVPGVTPERTVTILAARDPFDTAEMMARKDLAETEFDAVIETLVVQGGALTQTAMNRVLSGEASWDLWIAPDRSFWPMVRHGVFFPVQEIGTFTGTPALSYNGNRLSLNSIQADTTTDIHVLFWNKQLFSELGLPSPYDLYQNGNWTWHVLQEVLRQVTMDTTGDGQVDQVGLVNVFNTSAHILFSNGTAKFMSDLNGQVSFNYQDHRVIHTYDTLKNWVLEGTVRPHDRQMFATGKAAMLYDRYDSWVPLQLEDDYGMVPFPRGPQAAQHAFPASGVDGYLLPISTADPELMVALYSFLFEWQDQASALQGKIGVYAPDQESADLLSSALANWEIQLATYYSAMAGQWYPRGPKSEVIGGTRSAGEALLTAGPLVQAEIDSMLDQ